MLNNNFINKQSEISRLSRADVPEMLSIADACGLSRWSAEAYLEEIDREDSIGFGVRSSNLLEGFIIGRLVPGSSDVRSRDAEIFNIGVRPDRRRSGHGTDLINHFIKVCVNHSVDCIWLEVRSANAPAIQFYERNRFTKEHTRKAFYSSPTDDAVVMKSNLLQLPATYL